MIKIEMVETKINPHWRLNMKINGVIDSIIFVSGASVTMITQEKAERLFGSGFTVVHSDKRFTGRNDFLAN